MPVLVHPLIKVHDQFVTTRVGGTVHLRCTVEASPPSVNYWVKRSTSSREMGGNMRSLCATAEAMLIISAASDRNINPSRRFHPEEKKENPYTTVMTLTIKDVRPGDIANYTCIARSSKGSVRGTISLKSELFSMRTSKNHCTH